VDSHRNILAEAKSFLRWCTVKKRWLARNPLEEIEGVGKRKHGKTQLRVDEARKWLAMAVGLAAEGEAGAVAALLALVMGMRANEIVSRVVRDLDDEGKLLWIPDSKTEASRVERHDHPELRQTGGGGGGAAAPRDDRVGGGRAAS
jgi:integrase